MIARSGTAGPRRASSAAVVGGPGAWPWVVSVLAAVVVVGPGLGRGQVLVRDMVFVPSPALTGRLLGLGHEAPRAVPSDLVVALASHVVPAGVVQALVLLGILVGAGVGAARLAPRGAAAGSAAALVAVWNPYVGERLLMGQWALLVGYAACAWVVLGAARVARGEGRALPLAVGLVVGSLGGAAAWVLVVLTAVGAVLGVAVGTRDVRGALGRGVRWLPLALALALPWAVPALLRPGGLASDRAGFDVFAPGADSPLGTVGSVLTGGGTWNVAAIPPGRSSAVGAVAAVLVVGWAAAGFWLTRRGPVHDAEPAAAALRPAVLGAGVAGLGVALLATAGGRLAPLAGLPGGGLLRDGARELAPWLVLLGVGAGWGVRWLSARGLPRAAPALAALLPVVALPGLGWGVSGTLAAVEYPDDVLAVAAAADDAPGAGAVAVLPFQNTRSYPWNEDRPSLSPWTRLLHRRVVISSDLVVATPAGLRTVEGEDRYADMVGQALTAPDAAGRLVELGVGWVVVDATASVPEGAVEVRSGGDAALYRLPGVPGADGEIAAAYDPPAIPVVVGDVVALAAAALAVRTAVRPRRPVTEVSRGAHTIG